MGTRGIVVATADYASKNRCVDSNCIAMLIQQKQQYTQDRLRTNEVIIWTNDITNVARNIILEYSSTGLHQHKSDMNLALILEWVGI